MNDEIREFRIRFTEYVNELRKKSSESKMNELIVLRNFNKETLDKLGVFHLNKNIDMIIPKYMEELEDFGVISETNNKPIYADRYIIPILDTNNLVQALAGYTSEKKERYIYSTTKYFNRKDILYGLEETENIVKQNYAIIVEGLTDRIRLKQLGLNNILARAGARKSLLAMEVINAIADNVIFIPDRDSAGDLTSEYWKTEKYVRLLIPFTYKDIDELAIAKENNGKIIVNTLNNIISNLENIGFSMSHEMAIYC